LSTGSALRQRAARHAPYATFCRFSLLFGLVGAQRWIPDTGAWDSCASRLTLLSWLPGSCTFSFRLCYAHVRALRTHRLHRFTCAAPACLRLGDFTAAVLPAYGLVGVVCLSLLSRSLAYALFCQPVSNAVGDLVGRYAAVCDILPGTLIPLWLCYRAVVPPLVGWTLLPTTAPPTSDFAHTLFATIHRTTHCPCAFHTACRSGWFYIWFAVPFVAFVRYCTCARCPAPSAVRSSGFCGFRRAWFLYHYVPAGFGSTWHLFGYLRLPHHRVAPCCAVHATARLPAPAAPLLSRCTCRLLPACLGLRELRYSGWFTGLYAVCSARTSCATTALPPPAVRSLHIPAAVCGYG